MCRIIILSICLTLVRKTANDGKRDGDNEDRSLGTQKEQPLESRDRGEPVGRSHRFDEDHQKKNIDTRLRSCF